MRLEERRRRAAVAVVDAGCEPAVVARSVGVSTSTVHKWARAYRSGGEHALSPRTSAHAPPRLSAQETRRLMGLLLDTDPPDLGYEPALWSRDLVRRLVCDEFRTALSGAATSRLLQNSGIVLRRPQAAIVGSELSSVQAALGGDRRPRATGTVHCVTTSTVGEAHADPAWAPPSAAAPRGPVTIISEAAPRGTIRFAVRSGPLVASMLVELLERLCADVGGPLVVLGVAGPLRDHPQLRAYVTSTLGRVHVHPLTGGDR